MFLVLVTAAHSQDFRSVQSPNGQLEFRLFVSRPEEGMLFHLGYQVLYRGKPVLDTSYLGLDIRNQEPVLGENVGLTASNIVNHEGYRTLNAEYMQNGSIGRRIDLEVRIWDGAVAFRYLIPRTSALEEILIDGETTEFHLAHPPAIMPSNAPLPVNLTLAGIGRLSISETGAPEYPRSTISAGPSILVTRLTRRFEGQTPMVCPWRIIALGERPSLEILRDLSR
ncbi:MAG: glycoside hydrolase family 97 N-terminal domain-containing protein [Candidatus Solibacter sp.]